MVDFSAATPASGGLLRALFARKGEAAPAAPAVPVQMERPVASQRRGAVARRAGADSPLAFLISRRPAGAAPAEPAVPHEIDASSARQPAGDAALTAAPRRPLTVRLHHEDFQRLRAVTEASGATYQSLLEAGVLHILAADPGKTPAEPPAAAVPAAKRRALRR